MLASTAEKATWWVRSFCLVKSSYENNIIGVGTSCDKSFQAFPPLFVLQATKAGRGGLGTRLWISCKQDTRYIEIYINTWAGCVKARYTPGGGKIAPHIYLQHSGKTLTTLLWSSLDMLKLTLVVELWTLLPSHGSKCCWQYVMPRTGTNCWLVA